MTFPVRLMRLLLPAVLLASVGGCLPSGQSQMEEEKESHFLAGRSCLNSMDYQGAIDEFERALETNPRSASAHFQLGWLYEEKVPDPAAAIHHYERFLKLRPKADNAEVIRQHINNCKQDLAKTVLPLPVTPGMQREFEQLAEENKRLRDELEKWRVYAGRLQAATNQATSVAVLTRPIQAVTPMSTTTTDPGAIAGSTETQAPTGAGAARTYVVRAGDSPYGIARKNGVRLEALLAANPGLEPTRLRIGQTLNIPAP